MIETVISSTFNFFDIFVRLGPGLILVGCYYCCFNGTIPSLNLDPTFTLVLNIAIAYIAGSLIRAPWRAIKVRTDCFFFGGNPREIYTEFKESKHPVIKNEVIRRFAKNLVEEIVGQQKDLVLSAEKNEDPNADKSGNNSVEENQQKSKHESADQGNPILERTNPKGTTQKKTDNEIKKENHFAFSHMVNCLELNGKSSKTDRICSLVDMSSTIMTTLLICLVMLVVSGICTRLGVCDFGLEWNLAWWSIAITVFVLFVGIVLSGLLYVHYTQMRFTMIVQQYIIWKDKGDSNSDILQTERFKRIDQKLDELNEEIKKLKKAPEAE